MSCILPPSSSDSSESLRSIEISDARDIVRRACSTGGRPGAPAPPWAPPLLT